MNIASLPTHGTSQLALAGQWSWQTPTSTITARPVSVSAVSSSGKSLLSTADASSLSFLAHSLGTQADFPPFLSAFAATKFAPADDIRATQSSAENMLLASRLLLGSGIRAMVYSPLQDTLTPAGWGTTSAARYFRWDAALDLAGNREPRANGVLRNGQFISAWGAMLASSHVQADFGIVDLRTSVENTDEGINSRHAHNMEQLFRVAEMAGYAPELVNPAAQSADRLLRDCVIVLALPPKENFQLSEKAQSALVEFVRRGGTLAYFPVRPMGTLLEALWGGSGTKSGESGMPALPDSAPDKKFDEWAFESGRVVAAANDFYSWVALDEGLNENWARPERSAAIESLTALLESSGIHRSLLRSGTGAPNLSLVASQLVSNDSASSHPPVRPCVEGQLCAGSLISVTNLSSDEPANESFDDRQIDRASDAGTGGQASSRISFDVTVPARESLMLPVHAPLCAASVSGEHCSDEVVVAGAELLRAERDGKTLELTFYAPARAMVRLHLESEPSKVELDEDIHLDDKWKQETGELEVHLLRGAAPGYLRVLRVHLRYVPHVKERSDREKEERTKNNHRGMEFEVFDAIRFPIGTEATISTHPPLIATDANSGGFLVMASRNYSDEILASDFTVDGAFHGTGTERMFGYEQQFTRMRFQPSRNPAPGDTSAVPASDGLLRGNLDIRAERRHVTTPLLFPTAKEAGNSHYQFDFERDGELDWALESNRLRLIVSPAYGGHAIALVD